MDDKKARILPHLIDGIAKGVNELSRLTDIPVATVDKYLKKQQRYFIQTEDKKWTLPGQIHPWPGNEYTKDIAAAVDALKEKKTTEPLLIEMKKLVDKRNLIDLQLAHLEFVGAQHFKNLPIEIAFRPQETVQTERTQEIDKQELAEKAFNAYIEHTGAVANPIERSAAIETFKKKSVQKLQSFIDDPTDDSMWEGYYS